jgi:hypothetical protein
MLGTGFIDPDESVPEHILGAVGALQASGLNSRAV